LDGSSLTSSSTDLSDFFFKNLLISDSPGSLSEELQEKNSSVARIKTIFMILISKAVGNQSSLVQKPMSFDQKYGCTLFNSWLMGYQTLSEIFKTFTFAKYKLPGLVVIIRCPVRIITVLLLFHILCRFLKFGKIIFFGGKGCNNVFALAPITLALCLFFFFLKKFKIRQSPVSQEKMKHHAAYLLRFVIFIRIFSKPDEFKKVKNMDMGKKSYYIL